MKQYILDACALMALLQNEPGADKVAAVINAAHSGKATVTINTINLLEVYYDAYRTHGKEQANLMTAELRKRRYWLTTKSAANFSKKPGVSKPHIKYPSLTLSPWHKPQS
jgi:uncharacterized protein with PIN domain